MNKQYQPVNCNFYDDLETLATLHKKCEIIFWSDNGAKSVLYDQILDLYARDGIEYLKLSSGLEIRLDKLVEIDGKRPQPTQC